MSRVFVLGVPTVLCVLTLLGCSESNAREPSPAASSAGAENQEEAVSVIYAETLPEAREEPAPALEPQPLPEVREVSSPEPATGALVELETAYGRVVEAPLGATAPAPTMQDAVAALISQIEHAIELVRAVDTAATALPVGEARARGLLRRADARAALATRAIEASVPVSADLEASLSNSSEEVRSEVRAQVDRRIRETLAGQMRPLWCQAAALYAEAEALGGPDAEVARARRAAYGERFLASCLE